MKSMLGATVLLVVFVAFGLFSQTVLLQQPTLRALPDLVIREVTYQEIGTGDFRTYRFGIGIVNQGSGQAGAWTNAAVFIVSDIFSTQPAWLLGTTDVSPIVAGDGLMVFVDRVLSAPVGPCCVLVVLDAPTAGNPVGKMNEGAIGERNNGFVFFLSAPAGTQTYENPAFAP